MGNSSSLLALALGAVVSLGHAQPQAPENWFALQSVQGEDSSVEADASSLKVLGTRRLMHVRVTHPLPRTHRSGVRFRSVVAQVEIDCESSQVAYRDAQYFAQPRGAGSPVARDEPQLDPTSAPTLLVPVPSLQMLVRAACARTPNLR